MSPTPGIEIGPYIVEALLGAGGMGEVYLARDVRLERRVAIKRLARGAETSAILLREARAVAALNHPNIAAIYDVLDTPQGSFIVMEHVEGETLAAHLARGALPPAEAVNVARQLCAAMTAAHGAGIVHRDLKPSNVCFTANHQAKVLDFGVARRVAAEPTLGGAQPAAPSPAPETTLSTGGRLVGTPAYMAPEQLVNGAVDARTDVYAIGLLLYQMLTGVRPFASAGDDVVAGALARMSHVPPPSSVVPLPAALDEVVLWALAPDPADRPQSARALDAALEAVGLQPPRPQPGPGFPGGWQAVAGMVTALVLALVAARVWWPAARVPTASAKPTVLAVLPFAGETGDARSQVLGTYVAESVATLLRPARGLNVLSASALDELDMASPAGSPPRPPGVTPERAARQLGADYVVRGQLARRGSGVQVTVDVLKAGTDPVWRGERSAPATALRDLVRLVAADVSAALGVPASSLAGAAGGVAAGSAPVTENQEAFADYEQGRSFLARADVPGNVDRASALFESAIAQDPRFAAAYARLGQARLAKYEASNDAQWVAKAKDAFVEALRLDPARAEVRLALASLHRTEGKTDVAVEELRRAIADAPSSDEPHRELGGLLIDLGRTEEAIAELEQAIALRPNYFRNHSELGYAAFRAGRFAEAVQAYTRVTQLQPDSALGFHMLGTTHQAAGDTARALLNYERANALRPSALTLANIGTVHFWRGEYAEALRAYEQAVGMDPGDAIAYVNLGDVYRRLGRRGQAASSYEKALALYDDHLRVNPREPLTHAQVAIVSAILGRRAVARKHLEAALAAGRDDPDVLRAAAVVRAAEGDVAGACGDLGRALDAGYGAVLVRHDDDLAMLAGHCEAYDRVLAQPSP
jgi:serine/threonine-protein kinase